MSDGGQSQSCSGWVGARRHMLATRARACAAHSEGCAAADGGRRAALVTIDRGGRLRHPGRGGGGGVGWLRCVCGWAVSVCGNVCKRVCTCVRACVRACARAVCSCFYLRARLLPARSARMNACVCACVCACVRACARACVRVCGRFARACVLHACPPAACQIIFRAGDARARAIAATTTTKCLKRNLKGVSEHVHACVRA
jgi:hypothetical protein